VKANPQPCPIREGVPRPLRQELRFSLALARVAHGGGAVAADAAANAQLDLSLLPWVQLQTLKQFRFQRQFRLMRFQCRNVPAKVLSF